MANTISNSYKLKVVNQNGSLLQAPTSVPTVATAAISDISSYSNTAAMLANDATTYANSILFANGAAGNAYTNAIAYVDGKSFVNTSQLSSNLANYQTSAGLAANVATLTANNSTNFDGLSLGTVQLQITSNAATAYANAVTYVDTRSFVNTAVLALDLANYQTIAGLAFAVSQLQSNSATFIDGVTIATIDSRITSNASAAYTNAVNYTDSRSFVNTAQLSSTLTSYQTTAGLAANVATLTANNSTNFGGLSLATVQGQITGNAANAYTNAVAYVDGRSFVNTSQLSSNLANYQTTAGLAANVATLTANNSTNFGGLSLATVQGQITGNAANAYTNAVAYVDGRSFVNTSQLSANLALYQTTAGLSANVATLTANNSTNLGGIAAASYVNTSQLSSNLSNYQTTAGLAANVATLTANNSTNLGGVAAASYVNTSQLSSNLANYQTTAGIAANVATLTANNSTNLGGIPAASYVNTSQLSSNLSNYQTTAGLAANVATLTSNNSTNFGGLSLATVQGQITGNAAIAYTNATTFSSNATNITSGTVAEARLPFRMDQNVRSTDNVNFGSVTISGNLVVNGSYTVVTGNSVVYTDNMLFLNQGISANITNIVANGTHIVFTTNNNYQVGWDVLIAGVNPSSYNGLYLNITASNTTSFTVANTKTGAYVSGGTARGQTESNPDIGITAGYNDGTYAHTGFFRDHSSGVWKVFSGYLPEPDSSIYIDQTNASFTIAPFQASELRVGNNSSYGVVNTTNFTGTSNNALNLGGVAAASYVNTAQLSANLALYQTSAGLSANVATLTANNSTNLGGIAAASYVNTSQLSANLALYQTTAGLAANVATLTANNSTNLGGIAAASYVNTSQLSSNLALYQTSAGLSANVATLTANNSTNFNSQPASFYTNATNITTGTLPDARLSSAVVNTSGNFTIRGMQTFANGITFANTVTANGSNGTAGQVLTSAGSTGNVYWAPVAGGFTNGQSISVNNFVITGAFTANGSNGSAGQILISNGAGSYWGPAPTGSGGTVTQVSTGSGLTGGPVTTTGTVSVLANTGIIANATGVYVNSAYIATLDANNATNFSGVSLATVQGQITGNAATAYTNAVSYVDSRPFVNTSQLSSNLANYQTTAGLSANVATLTSNNSTNFGGQSLATIQGQITGNASTAYTNAVNYVTAQAFVNTAQLSANLTLYQTSAGLAANVLTLTSNNSTNFGGLSLATVQGQITGNAATAFTNATNFASNATNITSGTLPDARLSAAVVNTSGNFTVAGNINFTAANVFFANVHVGANVDLTTTSLVVGITTVNTVVTAGQVSLSGVTVNSTIYQGTANNANNLNGQLASFYTNATNITAGTLDNARLPAAINLTTVNAATLSVGSIVVANTLGLTTSANINISSTGELVIAPGAGIFANGSLGTAGQGLFSNGSSIYWDTVTAGVNVAAQYSWTNTHSFAANLTIGATSELIIANGAGIQANGGFGTAGQVLSSNGTGVYWATASGGGGRIDPRVSTTASATTVTPDIGSFDMYVFTALAAGLTINATTGGSPLNGNKLTFRFKDNGTARGLTWTTSGSNSFRAIGVTLPTTTVINKVTYVGCIYNSEESFWDVVAVLTQA